MLEKMQQACSAAKEQKEKHRADKKRLHDLQVIINLEIQSTPLFICSFSFFLFLSFFLLFQKLLAKEQSRREKAEQRFDELRQRVTDFRENISGHAYKKLIDLAGRLIHGEKIRERIKHDV